MKYLIFLLLLGCSSVEKINTDTFLDRLNDGKDIVLINTDKSKQIRILANIDRALGARSLNVRDLKDPYNTIPVLVIDKVKEDELYQCREPLQGDCLALVESIWQRLDWNYILVKSGDSLSSLAAQHCGGSKYASTLRRFNFPYGDCKDNVDVKDQGLCLMLSSGTPIRIPPACSP